MKAFKHKAERILRKLLTQYSSVNCHGEGSKEKENFLSHGQANLNRYNAMLYVYACQIKNEKAKGKVVKNHLNLNTLHACTQWQ